MGDTKLPVSFHVSQFSDKVRILNQTNHRTLMLTAAEARNLHHDIFALMAKITVLNDTVATLTSSTDQIPPIVDVDCGKF
jgi:hypothetical protein